MGETKYEVARDETVKHVQQVFRFLGIDVLAQTVRDVISPKKKEGRGKAIDSDNDYDPCSDIENQSDTDDDYDDDLNNEVNTEVRCIANQIHMVMACLFHTYTPLYLIKHILLS